MKKEKDLDDLKMTFKFNDFQGNNVNKCYNQIDIGVNTKYVKYSGKKHMYDILESDELLMFCSELSNDVTENKILSGVKREDIYISCFYHTNSNNTNDIPPSDVYSQWMSYCSDGGASFEFYFFQDVIGEMIRKHKHDFENVVKEASSINKNIFNYSILVNEESGACDYIKYPQYPFQIQYFKTDSSNIMKTNLNLTNHTFFQSLKMHGIPLSKITPYLKDSGFIQESEARLAFVDENGYLSNCIKFFESNGGRIPYISVKFGNIDDDLHPCGFLDPYAGKTLDEKAQSFFKTVTPAKYNSMVPIVIPQGHDQESVYNAIEKELKKYNSKYTSSPLKISVICQGHLPITKITLAPTQDRNEQKKMMEIYCKSKYWLRNVEICSSVLPYNTKNLNHT